MKNLTKKEKKMAIARAVLTVIMILLMIAATLYFLPIVSKLSNEGYRIEFKEKVSNMGLKGILFVLGLQILQIVIAVLPGQPMEIVSGMLYGTWGGMLLCLVGIFIGNIIIFYTVRKIGTDFMQLFFSPEKIEEIKNSKAFKNSAKFEFLMFIIFLIPMIPKDIFIYLGGLSPVRPKRFLTIATLARIPGLFMTVFMGNSLTEGSYTLVVGMIALFLIIGLIGYYISNRTQKELEK